MISKSDKFDKVQKCTVCNLNKFIFKKDSLEYSLIVENKSETIDFQIFNLTQKSSYKNEFILNDLIEIAQVFTIYNNLKEIFEDLCKKLAEEDFEFFEDHYKFGLKFNFKCDFRSLDALIHLLKVNEIDKDLVNSKVNYDENFIKRLEEKLKIFEEKSEDQGKTLKLYDQKFAQLLDNISRLEEKISQHEDSLKITKKLDDNRIENSKIILEEDIQLIKKWIDESNYNKIYFKLLYRGTENGKGAQDFHSRCDNKGPTITFIKTTTNKIFGGFTNLSWESRINLLGAYKSNDPYAFIFSIDKKIKLNCNDTRYITYCSSSTGPVFGNGFDIGIYNNWDSNCYSKIKNYGKNEGIISENFLLGTTESYNFMPEEVEVFSVLFI